MGNSIIAYSFSLPLPQSYFISLAVVVCTLSLEFSSPEKKNELLSNSNLEVLFLSTKCTVGIIATLYHFQEIHRDHPSKLYPKTHLMISSQVLGKT